MENSLLQPSLSKKEFERKGLSLRSQVVVAFIGGPFPSLLFQAFHSKNIGTVKKDLLLLLLPFTLIAFVSFFGVIELIQLYPEYKRIVRYIPRLAALAFVGLYYLNHRSVQKYIESFESYKKAFLPAIICLILGLFIEVALTGIQL